MKIDPALRAHIQGAFAPLRNRPAHAFPPPASLSEALSKFNPGPIGVVPAGKTPEIARMFTTAAVDMWLRSVHSFLISASLTNVSPIWASAVGYYSSHYTVRSLAHLLGFFQLFSRKKIVRLELQGGAFVCSFNAKAIHDREHTFYWKIVKSNPLFAADQFFTNNPPPPTDEPRESDVGHRDRANYADHLAGFPRFQPLDAAAVRNRIDKISDIEVQAPPIPRVSRYPDIEYVQLIAYHRLMRFRDLVDAIIGAGNRFWDVHRNPAWARAFMDFQVTAEPTLRSQFTL